MGYAPVLRAKVGLETVRGVKTNVNCKLVQRPMRAKGRAGMARGQTPASSGRSTGIYVSALRRGRKGYKYTASGSCSTAIGDRNLRAAPLAHTQARRYCDH